MRAEPILVLGGTGHYGREIVRSLVEKQVPVRVLTRNAGKAREILGAVPELVEGDLASPQAVKESVAGVPRVVVAVSAFSPAQIRRMKAIEQDAVIDALQEAWKAGARRAVLISVFDVKGGGTADTQAETGNIKLQVEKYLAGSGFNWTVLGAPPSMEIFFRMTRGSAMNVPGGGPEALPTVSPRDMGEIAAQAVLRDDLDRRRFRVAGEVVSFPEAARRISAAVGRPIRFRKIPLILPKIAWVLTAPLSPFSDRILYVHTVLGFIRLLNTFPREIAEAARADRQRLIQTFRYVPTSIEAEAEWRMSRTGKR